MVESDMLKLLDSDSLTFEEILLPTEVMKEIADTLSQSTASLPPSAKKFREWNVGFLERFVAKG